MGHAILQIQRAISLIINTHFFKIKDRGKQEGRNNNFYSYNNKRRDEHRAVISPLFFAMRKLAMYQFRLEEIKLTTKH